MGGQRTIYSCSSLTGFASLYPSVYYFGLERNQFVCVCIFRFGKTVLWDTSNDSI